MLIPDIGGVKDDERNLRDSFKCRIPHPLCHSSWKDLTTNPFGSRVSTKSVYRAMALGARVLIVVESESYSAAILWADIFKTLP